MLKTLKAIWIFFWAILLTLLLFLPIVIAALAGKRGDAAFHGTQIFAWVILKVCGIRLVVRGREHIQPSQRYVILSNHASYFDPPALVLALGLQYRWVIKKELRKVPLFGLALETSRNLFIDRARGSDALESIKQGVAQLPDGTGILMFPEGTRSWDGQLLPFKKGGLCHCPGWSAADSAHHRPRLPRPAAQGPGGVHPGSHRDRDPPAGGNRRLRPRQPAGPGAGHHCRRTLIDGLITPQKSPGRTVGCLPRTGWRRPRRSPPACRTPRRSGPRPGW